MKLLTSSATLAPIEYYARLYGADSVLEDRGEHFLKQTFRNRYLIATPTGSQPLTIPIVRDGATRTPMRDIRISDHGNWRHLHWTALVSAYESSPFFEYYADDFRPIFEKDYTFLVDFNEALLRIVLNLLQLDVPYAFSNDYVEPSYLREGNVTDLRNAFSPKAAAATGGAFHPVPYWQVFATRTGFLPNLSIIDLLFNMGNESRLVLRQSFG